MIGPRNSPRSIPKLFRTNMCFRVLNVNTVINGCVMDQYVVSWWGHFTRDGPVRQPRDKGYDSQ